MLRFREVLCLINDFKTLLPDAYRTAIYLCFECCHFEVEMRSCGHFEQDRMSQTV